MYGSIYTCSSTSLCGALRIPVSFSLICQLHHGRNSANLANADKPAQKHCAWLRMQPLILHCTGNTLLTCKHAQDALGSEKSMFPRRIYGIIPFCRGKCSLKRNLKEQIPTWWLKQSAYVLRGCSHPSFCFYFCLSVLSEITRGMSIFSLIIIMKNKEDFLWKVI